MPYASVSPRAAAFGLGGPEESLAERLKNLEASGMATPTVSNAEYLATMTWWRSCDPEGHDAWRATRPALHMPRLVYDHVAAYVAPRLAASRTVYKDIFGRPKPEAEQQRLRANEAWHAVKDSLGCPTGTYREQVFGFAPSTPDISRTLISSLTAAASLPSRQPPPPDGRPPPTEARAPDGRDCPRGFVYDGASAQCVPAVGRRAPTNGAPPAPPVCPEGTLFSAAANACVPGPLDWGPPPVDDAEEEILDEMAFEEAALVPFRLPWWVWLGMAVGGVGVAFWLGKRGEPTGNPYDVPTSEPGKKVLQAWATIIHDWYDTRQTVEETRQAFKLMRDAGLASSLVTRGGKWGDHLDTGARETLHRYVNQVKGLPPPLTYGEARIIREAGECPPCTISEYDHLEELGLVGKEALRRPSFTRKRGFLARLFG